jgi:glutaconate CoA-transferase subunit B
VFVVVRQSNRTFVERVDFITSLGHGRGGDDRSRFGLRGAGPTVVITDLGVLRPDHTGELVLAATHPGVAVDDVRDATGWQLRTAAKVEVSAPPSAAELRALRALQDKS